MAKKSSSDSKRDDDDLDDMRRKFNEHKKRAEGGGGGGKEDWDKLGDGKNMRRILPRPGMKKFFTEGWTHFNVGPNQRAVRCIDEGSMDDARGLPNPGTKCPLCKKFLREQSRVNSEFAKGDEEGHAEWKRAKDKFVPRHQFYSNVLRKDDDGDVEVKILSYGPQIWGGLMNYFLGEEDAIGDFTDPKSGRWMNIKKEKKGGRDRRNVGYTVVPSSSTTSIAEAWDDIVEALHDLDAAPGKLLSADEVIAIMKGVDLDKGGDDDDSDDDSSSRKKKSKSKSKSRSDDDDDEEEDEDDSDDDEEEEEEEEDDEPVKVKGSKLAGKMKKRRDD